MGRLFVVQRTKNAVPGRVSALETLERVNQVIVTRSDTLKRSPMLPVALYKAYEAAKARAYERRLDTTLMPWGQRHWSQVFDLFGGDPLCYGLGPIHLDVVSNLAGFLHDRKLISTIPQTAELFLPID